ncbi:MAG: sodium:calcium antiporter, partial [Pirellulaceae bacterium]
MTTELAILIATFLGLSVVILIAGHYMAAAADVIGEKTGMGGSLAGLILLAAATSLPELAINIAAVR